MDAFGFIPMDQALAMNQGFSGGRPNPYDTQQSVLDALEMLRSQAARYTPFGKSFESRFGADSPLGQDPSQGRTFAPEQNPEVLSQFLGALYRDAQDAGAMTGSQVTRHSGSGTYAGPMLESSGPLQAQPWYDSFLAAAQQNAPLPMVNGGGGTPINKEKQSAYRAQRQQTQNSRWDAVRNKAQAKSSERAVRMGNMSRGEADLQALGRLGLDQSMMDLMLGGPEYAAANRRTDMQREVGMRAVDAEHPQADPTMAAAVLAKQLYAESRGDWNNFRERARGLGKDDAASELLWRAATGRGPNDPEPPGFWSSMIDSMKGSPQNNAGSVPWWWMYQ